jgi:GNAT superfamily N-acetyltransferase
MQTQRPLVRPVQDHDLPQVAKVALANGEQGRGSGSDSRYVGHLSRHGRFLVAELDGLVVGYGATRPVGDTTMLCDLFIDPARQGSGIGRRLLDQVLDGCTEIFTFSSRNPRAMPLYVRYGLVPRWPLLYLAAAAVPPDPPASSASPRVAVHAVSAGRAADAERELTGIDREPDHAFWATMPGATGLIALLDGEPVAAGAGENVAGAGVLRHLAVAPGTDAVTATVAALAGLGATSVRACLPGPHPALRGLLTGGWRIEEYDHHMSTRDGLIDPRQVLSPALA